MNQITVSFNIFPSRNFFDEIRTYYGYDPEEEITNEEITEFLNNTIKPARSGNSTYEVEGGDTDGWFIQSVERR